MQLVSNYGMAAHIVDPEPPPPLLSAVTGLGVIAVLGHVDHGKTTLLDGLFGSDVATREAGGITQSLRPSILSLREATCEGLHSLAFIDTPGHRVFHGMRVVASDSADAALIVVAADAGIQLQTREALRRCIATGQPVLFALTKIDKLGGSLIRAQASKRATALRAAIRRLWANELRRAGHKDRLVRRYVSKAPIVVLCAPQRWNMDRLIQALTSTMRCSQLEHSHASLACPSMSALSARNAATNKLTSGSAAGFNLTHLASPVKEGIAVVLESQRVNGLGTSLLAVVRHGTLERSQRFVCGSTSGRIRQLGLVQRGGISNGILNVQQAAVGQPVRIVVGWDQQSDQGSFEVGDLLRAWPHDAIRALVDYRQMVDAFRATRIDLTTQSLCNRSTGDNAQGEVFFLQPQHVDSRTGAARSSSNGLNEATGAAAIVKTQSAGEAQGLIDFLAARRTGNRLILLSYGIGQPRDEEMILAKDALKQRVPCAIYTLNLKVSAERHRRAAQIGVSIREHTVFHELLMEMLEAAGLPAPAQELAAMRRSGATDR